MTAPARYAGDTVSHRMFRKYEHDKCRTAAGLADDGRSAQWIGMKLFPETYTRQTGQTVTAMIAAWREHDAVLDGVVDVWAGGTPSREALNVDCAHNSDRA